MIEFFTERYEGVTDRTGWGEGPWDGEPDKVVWVDRVTGLDCMARRGGLGAWCGYVGVRPAHPWHGDDYQQHEGVETHGGLTFAGACEDGGDPAGSICHVSDEPVWWFGFDCAHFMDIRPAERLVMAAIGRDDGDPPGVYRTLDWVMRETGELAGQIAEAR